MQKYARGDLPDSPDWWVGGQMPLLAVTWHGWSIIQPGFGGIPVSSFITTSSYEALIKPHDQQLEFECLNYLCADVGISITHETDHSDIRHLTLKPTWFSQQLELSIHISKPCREKITILISTVPKQNWAQTAGTPRPLCTILVRITWPFYRFWAASAVALAAIDAIPRWMKEKVVQGCLLLVTFLGHLIFLVTNSFLYEYSLA